MSNFDSGISDDSWEDHMKITLPLSNPIIYPDDSPIRYSWAGYETLKVPYRQSDRTEVVYYYPSAQMGNLKNIANSFEIYCRRLSLDTAYLKIVSHSTVRLMIEMNDNVSDILGTKVKPEYVAKTYSREQLRYILRALPFISPEIEKFVGVNLIKKYDSIAIDYALDFIINRIGYAGLADNSKTGQMLKVVLETPD